MKESEVGKDGLATYEREGQNIGVGVGIAGIEQSDILGVWVSREGLEGVVGRGEGVGQAMVVSLVCAICGFRGSHV